MSNALKPQDVLVLLKLAVIREPMWTYAGLAGDLGLSVSEAHAAVKRLVVAQLVFADSRTVFHGNAVEFLVHGVRYAFPGGWGSQAVGLPTAYAAPPLNEHILPGTALPPVWASGLGATPGIALTPLYRSVPEAAHRDGELYELLTLVDSLRIGKARERMIAAQLIRERIYTSRGQAVA